VRLQVDNSVCQGHARCNAVAPEVFELDDLGYVATPSGDVAPGLETQAKKGAAACPEHALTIS
jgi:ferredoxin